MYVSLFNLRDNKTDTVSVASVIKRDVALWFTSGVSIVLLYYGIAAIISGSLPSGQKHALAIALATLYQQQLLVYILIFCGCFLVFRGLTVRTWATFAFLVLCIAPQYYSSVINTLFPNSIVACMTALMGVMATFRLIEYYDMRFNIHVEDFYMTKASTATYVLIVLIAVCCQLPY